jgi:hypothetical protein
MVGPQCLSPGLCHGSGPEECFVAPGLVPDSKHSVLKGTPQPPQALLLRHFKIAAVVRGEWSPQPRVTQSHSILNSNKQYKQKTRTRLYLASGTWGARRAARGLEFGRASPGTLFARGWLGRGARACLDSGVEGSRHSGRFSSPFSLLNNNCLPCLHTTGADVLPPLPVFPILRKSYWGHR